MEKEEVALTVLGTIGLGVLGLISKKKAEKAGIPITKQIAQSIRDGSIGMIKALAKVCNDEQLKEAFHNADNPEAAKILSGEMKRRNMM